MQHIVRDLPRGHCVRLIHTSGCRGMQSYLLPGLVSWSAVADVYIRLWELVDLDEPCSQVRRNTTGGMLLVETAELGLEVTRVGVPGWVGLCVFLGSGPCRSRHDFCEQKGGPCNVCPGCWAQGRKRV